MTLIALTGTIASGKSTAIKMLKENDYSGFPYQVKFVDLDEYCKTLLPKMPELGMFYREVMDISYLPHADFVINHIFTDPDIYKKYCECFSPYIFQYLNSLTYDKDVVYVVEASAFGSYPDIHSLFSSVIVIDAAKPIRERNRKLRQIDQKDFDIINSTFKMPPVIPTIVVQLEQGTLQEMRGKVEEAFIRCCHEINPKNYKPYLTDAIWTLDYLASQTSNDDWNYNPYHNKHHSRNVLTDLIIRGHHSISLGLTAVYHDWKYQPKCRDNEDRSANWAYNHITAVMDRDDCQAWSHILTEDVRNKVIYFTRKSAVSEVAKTAESKLQTFFLSDIAVFGKSADEIIESSHLIFKECGHVDWPTFQAGNLKILADIRKMDIVPDKLKTGINIAMAWVRSFKPKIGWFCGSFHPFTIGHLDVLLKAEKQFDKVVIVQAVNPLKDRPKSLESSELDRYEIIANVKSVPQLLAQCNYTPVLIRGIRNHQDLDDAQIWINQINEFTSETIQCIMILGEQKYSHISSSFIRHAQSIGADVSKFLVN